MVSSYSLKKMPPTMARRLGFDWLVRRGQATAIRSRCDEQAQAATQAKTQVVLAVALYAVA